MLTPITSIGLGRIFAISILSVIGLTYAVRRLGWFYRDRTRLSSAEATSRQGEAQRRLAIHAARIGEWDIDLKSGIGTYSAYHARIFGFQEVAGAWSIDMLVQHAHPEDRNKVTRSFWAAVDAVKDWHCDCRVLWSDGSTHWVSLHGTPLRDNVTSAPVRVVGIVIDVTERALAEQSQMAAQRLETEKRQIHEASRQRSQLLAGMAHDLRTPLNAIIGFADLLYSGAVARDSTKHQVFVGHIASSGRQLLQLINDVVDLSKLEAGHLGFHAQTVDLALLVKETANAFRAAKSSMAVNIVEDVEALNDVVLDGARFKQVIHNLLSTAIKYTVAGGRVTIRAMSENAAHFRLEVEVPSTRMAAEALPRLFDELQLNDAPPTRRKGIDIGLWVARRLIEAQGGTVGVRSMGDGGWIFHLVLNRVHGTDAPREPLPLSPASQESRQRLLVIKDSRRDQTDFTNGLAAAGFEVVQASTAEQAVQQARQEKYDAIALDLLLSEQSGLKVLQSIRSAGLSRESPVVSVAMAADPRSTATFAISNVLSKPIDGEELAQAMTRFLKSIPRTARVLVIDDDALAVELMCTTLRGMGIESFGLTDSQRVLEEMDLRDPDALVLDLMMPGFDGFAVLDTLRRSPLWRDVPVFIWTSMVLSNEDYLHLQRSVHDIFSKGGGALQTALEDLRNQRYG
jgi:PAS domain S-box-containing protein